MALSEKQLNDYRREYNKTAYKTVKVYIPVDEYDSIKKHMESQGYDKMSGYIKALIDRDMQRAGQDHES